jgi:hypothetical protein
LEDENIREQIFELAYEIFNDGRHVDDDLLAGKLMLLSKTNDPNPRAEDTRPIVILNTQLKVVQAILLYLTEDFIW